MTKVCSKINETWQFFAHNSLSFQPFSRLFFLFFRSRKALSVYVKEKNFGAIPDLQFSSQISTFTPNYNVCFDI